MGSLPLPHESSSPFKVLIVGGSYAGLSAAVNLMDLCQGRPTRGGNNSKNTSTAKIPVEISIVDERDGFYHIIGSPLLFASNEYAEKAWVCFKDIPALQDASNIHTIQGSVTKMDLAAKKADIKMTHGGDSVTVDYDFVVVASGLRRVFPVVAQSLDRDAYLAEVAPHVESVTNAKEGVLVVGGGAVGIEMAAELKYAQPHVKVTLAHSRDRLLSSELLDDCVGIKTAEILRSQDIDVLLEHRLLTTQPVPGQPDLYDVKFTNGHSMRANVVIMAISKSEPATSFLPPEALAEDGLVRVQTNLSFPDTAPHCEYAFAAGDVTYWSGIKRCGGAMYKGNLVAINIHQKMLQLLFGTEPEYFGMMQVKPMIGIALGDQAVSYRNGGELKFGREVAKNFFDDDLGFKICWGIMGLGKTSKDFEEEKKKE